FIHEGASMLCLAGLGLGLVERPRQVADGPARAADVSLVVPAAPPTPARDFLARAPRPTGPFRAGDEVGECRRQALQPRREVLQRLAGQGLKGQGKGRALDRRAPGATLNLNPAIARAVEVGLHGDEIRAEQLLANPGPRNVEIAPYGALHAGAGDPFQIAPE